MAPKPPPSPEEGNIASDLKAYEEQEVEVDGGATAGAGEGDAAAATEEDWFEDDIDEDHQGPETVSPSGH